MLRKNNLLPLLLCIIPCFLMNAETPAVVVNYLEQYRDIAIREMHRSGIPASITLAQGLHESGLGKGRLARHSNNHFGIKCKRDWQGPTYYIEDDDYENGKLVKSCFRAYDNPEASFIDHSNFLMENKRYARLFQLAPTDYVGWAKGLRKCGYATNPKYADILIRTIRNYNLAQFDTYPPQDTNMPVAHTQQEQEAALAQSPVHMPATDAPPAAQSMDYPAPPPAMLIPENYVRNSFRSEEEEVAVNSPATQQMNNPPAVTNTSQLPAIEHGQSSPPAAVQLPPDETTDRSTTVTRQSPRYNLGAFKRRKAKNTTAYQQKGFRERGISQNPSPAILQQFKRRK